MPTRVSLTFKHSYFQTGLRAANSGIGPLFTRLPVQTITTTVHSTVLNSHALDVFLQTRRAGSILPLTALKKA